MMSITDKQNELNLIAKQCSEALALKKNPGKYV